MRTCIKSNFRSSVVSLGAILITSIGCSSSDFDSTQFEPVANEGSKLLTLSHAVPCEGGDPATSASVTTPEQCCSPDAVLRNFTSSADVASLNQSNVCALLREGNDRATAFAGPVTIIGGPGGDTMTGSSSGDTIRGGSGNDIIRSGSGNDVVHGDTGNDYIDAGGGNDLIDPGPGIDVVYAGAGNDKVVVHNLCEVGRGELLDGGSGTDILVTPVPVAQLAALGVTVRGFETISVEATSCESECVAKPLCSGHGVCKESSPAGTTACACDYGWAGDDCSYLAVCDSDSCCTGPNRNQCLCDNQGGKWQNGSCCLTAQCKCEAAGNVWTNGACYPPGTTIITLKPNFYILSHMYAAPGVGSSTKYGTASALTVRTQHVFDSRVSAVSNVNSNFADLETKVTVGKKTGNSIETSTVRGSAIEIVSNSDGINHWYDQWLLWLNPELKVTRDAAGNMTTQLTGPPGAQTMLVSVKEVNEGRSSNPMKNEILTKMSFADKLEIFRTNPWAEFAFRNFIPLENVNLDLASLPDRFARMVDSQGVPRVFQVQGPFEPGAPANYFIETFAYNSALGSIKGDTGGGSVRALFGAKFGFGIEGGVMFGAEAEWGFENVTESLDERQHEAEVAIGTATPCWHQNIQAWYDAGFGTYAFQPHNGDPGGGGCATLTSSGRALATDGTLVSNSVVELALADGQRVVVRTDANGIYRLYGFPASVVGARTTQGQALATTTF